MTIRESNSSSSSSSFSSENESLRAGRAAASPHLEVGQEEMHDEKNQPRVAPLDVGSGGRDLPRKSSPGDPLAAEHDDHQLAAMLSHLASTMRALQQARVHVPIVENDQLAGFNRFTVADVDRAQRRVQEHCGRVCARILALQMHEAGCVWGDYYCRQQIAAWAGQLARLADPPEEKHDE